MALEEVDTEDPYELYEQSPNQQDVAIKDVVVGTGQSVEGENQLLTVKYSGTFMSNQQQFDQSKDFVCRTGKNTILPGFEKGLMVRNTLEGVEKYIVLTLHVWVVLFIQRFTSFHFNFIFTFYRV
jgi:hypothetical protein